VRRSATVTKTINSLATTAFTMDPKAAGSSTGQCPLPLP
jgi:hypothetical protein